MWLSKRSGSISKSIGTGIKLARAMGQTWVRMPESTKIQRLELNHKVVGLVHIHIQVQFYWNENLPICQWVDIDQVQGFMVKLNLGESLQDSMIFDFHQYD